MNKKIKHNKKQTVIAKKNTFKNNNIENQKAEKPLMSPALCSSYLFGFFM